MHRYSDAHKLLLAEKLRNAQALKSRLFCKWCMYMTNAKSSNYDDCACGEVLANCVEEVHLIILFEVHFCCNLFRNDDESRGRSKAGPQA